MGPWSFSRCCVQGSPTQDRARQLVVSHMEVNNPFPHPPGCIFPDAAQDTAINRSVPQLWLFQYQTYTEQELGPRTQMGFQRNPLYMAFPLPALHILTQTPPTASWKSWPGTGSCWRSSAECCCLPLLASAVEQKQQHSRACTGASMTRQPCCKQTACDKIPAYSSAGSGHLVLSSTRWMLGYRSPHNSESCGYQSLGKGWPGIFCKKSMV